MLATVVIGAPALIFLAVIAVGYFILRDLIGPRNAAIVALILFAAWLLLVVAGTDARL